MEQVALGNLINTGLSVFLKILVLLMIFLYVVFAAVVARQVHLMNKVVHEANFAGVLFLIAFIHFVAAVSLFIIAVIAFLF